MLEPVSDVGDGPDRQADVASTDFLWQCTAMSWANCRDGAGWAMAGISRVYMLNRIGPRTEP